MSYGLLYTVLTITVEDVCEYTWLSEHGEEAGVKYRVLYVSHCIA
jgi:hypothetical protein